MRKDGFSLIVPVYNETTRFIDGITEIFSFLNKSKDNWELIIVDDGSLIPVSDMIASRYIRKNVRIHRLTSNQGKGKAIAEGIRLARLEHILFTDVDCSVSISSIPQFRAVLRTHDMAIASRRMSQSQVDVHQPFFREFAGVMYTWLANFLCGVRVYDVTCGFKAYRAVVAKQLFAQSRIHRWSFDAEILFLARKANLRIAQVPVVWANKAGSRVKFSHMVGAFVDLLTIRLNALKGMYS